MLKEFPLVSIVLLTYNHEKYIKDCLMSILEQDYKNIEVIILDDASKDKTAIVVESCLKVLKGKFGRVVFYKNKKNSGNIPYNMNRLLKDTKGAYCKMLSGDDILEYNCISRLTRTLLENPQCSVVYSNVYVIEDNYRRGEWTDKTKNMYLCRRSGEESKDFFRKLLFGNCIIAPAAMIKKDVMKKNGLLDESIPYEDYEYWLRLSCQGIKFYFLNECLVYYRRSVTSMSNFKIGEKNKKIRIGMISDEKTHHKYLKYVSEQDREKCKEIFYRKYLRVCWEEKYWRGFLQIARKIKKDKIPFPKDIFIKAASVQHKTFEKNQLVIKMLEKWICNVQEGKVVADYFRNRDWKAIGIYGLGWLANRLCDELSHTEIEIRYIIDRRADMILSDIRLVTLNDDLEEVDAIVATPAGEYLAIKEQLEKKVACPIVYIGDILFS